uniref:GH18 domain-containing protein n=1 Tax=Timema poppense TaxID=170557 RepID=A0A7R9GWK6_TIMPO|nr:unnamed protein product [Timema poppensis]
MSFFGNAFTLRHPSENGVGAPALGPAPGTEGILRYSQICKSQLEDDDWTIDWDDEAEVPFASRGSLWVAYDDPESIAEKVGYLP